MSPAPDRRGFLRQFSGGAAAAWLPCATGLAFAALKPSDNKDPPVAATPPPALLIVDTHQHLWDLTKFSLPWTKGEKTLARSFVMSDYLAATRGLGVLGTVYMEVDVDPAQQVQEAEYVIDL